VTYIVTEIVLGDDWISHFVRMFVRCGHCTWCTS